MQSTAPDAERALATTASKHAHQIVADTQRLRRASTRCCWTATAASCFARSHLCFQHLGLLLCLVLSTTVGASGTSPATPTPSPDPSGTSPATPTPSSDPSDAAIPDHGEDTCLRHEDEVHGRCGPDYNATCNFGRCCNVNSTCSDAFSSTCPNLPEFSNASSLCYLHHECLRHEDEVHGRCGPDYNATCGLVVAANSTQTPVLMPEATHARSPSSRMAPDCATGTLSV